MAALIVSIIGILVMFSIPIMFQEYILLIVSAGFSLAVLWMLNLGDFNLLHLGRNIRQQVKEHK